MTSFLRYPFGREKDKPIHECNKGSLKFYVKNLKLGNPKFDDKNIAMARECLLYLKMEDVFSIVDEIDESHAAWQLCHDSINAMTDARTKRKPAPPVAPAPDRSLPTIQLAPKNDLDVLKSIQELVDDLERHAIQFQALYTEYDQKGRSSTKSSEHTPF